MLHFIMFHVIICISLFHSSIMPLRTCYHIIMLHIILFMSLHHIVTYTSSYYLMHHVMLHVISCIISLHQIMHRILYLTCHSCRRRSCTYLPSCVHDHRLVPQWKQFLSCKHGVRLESSNSILLFLLNVGNLTNLGARLWLYVPINAAWLVWSSNPTKRGS